MTRQRPIWTWIVLGIVLLPFLATLVAATSVDFSKGAYGGGITLDWLAAAWVLLAPSIMRSVLVGIIVLLANLVLGGTLAWWVSRTTSPFARIAVYLANVPLAVPGIAISIALIGTFAALRPSGLLLVAGHILFTLPFTIAALVPVLGSRELLETEQVARSLGASPFRTLWSVTIPAAAVAIIQASGMAFALSFGEFNVSFFVNPPATPMAPFALFDAYQTRRLELASAETIIFILCAALVIGLITWSRTIGSSRRASQ
ncbi:ABC transporter permease subunit [Pseudoclavibacter chungangensis]|uniref:ABC transporter permease subunit n=1 Tax=Pseudoclavibacter chungangensis TaxID=587635 RepID=A0A7J5C1S1_9MICO|nr:ABC transporter permease subunit [Pseudoclavibacter chungangensis]KAB1662568.1 ABC transporter permease subunit [Pseudoclavibacter chungangensis]NYJ68613.1 putative spermidine/putrescine transport system permease protein [Pseudoclavibacter chungangensis]